ncbi:MAG TPA: hypothetical protein VKU85_02705 [bacterium]|nr:hypothetical protein [bacterium]
MSSRPLFVTLAAVGSMGTPAPPPGLAAGAAWDQILHLQDGRYNNAARIAYDVTNGEVRLAWKYQVGTDSNTRQVAAGAWPGTVPGWSFTDLTANVSSKEYPDVAVAPDGVAHVVWREHLGGGNWQVFHADDRGGAWGSPTQLTFDATLKGSAVVAVGDPGGIVHVAYSTLESGSDNDEIHYLLYDSVADTSATIPVTDDLVTDDDASIAVTADGVVSIAWLTGLFSGAVRCVEGDLGGFTEIPTGVGADAAQPDLALDADGRQHLVYRHTLGGGNRVIRYVRRAGAGFTAPIDASPTDAFYTQPSLLVAAGGFPAVAYVANTSGHRGLYVSDWDSSQFASPDTVHADENVTYNETDFAVNPISVGLPRRAASGAFVVTSTGYVEADTVRADLHVFEGAVSAVSAPVVSAPDPGGLRLAARPTPFRSGTVIGFTLPEPARRVRLDVHDVTGRRVARLADTARGAGTHRIRWSPERLAGGVYWIRLDADGRRETVAVHRVR